MSCGEGVGGYYCHTANDQCVDDSDCVSTGGYAACGYSTANGRWECTMIAVCAIATGH
jgi:hypothetical protein